MGRQSESIIYNSYSLFIYIKAKLHSSLAKDLCDHHGPPFSLLTTCPPHPRFGHTKPLVVSKHSMFPALGLYQHDFIFPKCFSLGCLPDKYLLTFQDSAKATSLLSSFSWPSSKYNQFITPSFVPPLFPVLTSMKYLILTIPLVFLFIAPLPPPPGYCDMTVVKDIHLSIFIIPPPSLYSTHISRNVWNGFQWKGQVHSTVFPRK